MVRMISATVMLCATAALAQDDVLVERPLGTTDAGYGFLSYVPPGYSTSSGRHALVLFLHGAGETGGGLVPELWNEMSLHGPARLLRTGATIVTLPNGQREARGGSRIFADDDAVVVVPQSPAWWNAAGINTFMTWVMHHYRIDPRRIYVTGISMGGAGTWNFLTGQGRERIASAVPICGAQAPGSGARLLKTSIWALHSWGDATVTVNNSTGWATNIGSAHAGMTIPPVLTGYPHRDGGVGAPASRTMTALYADAGFTWVDGAAGDGGSPVRLTLYTDSSHDSWTRTYNNADVWRWLFRARSVVHPDFDTGLVVDDLDDGFSADGGWTRLQPSAGGYYGWEVAEAQVSGQPSAFFTGSVPMAGVYRLTVSGVGGSSRTVTNVDVSSAAGAQRLTWDQRDGGVRRLGEVSLAGSFTVALASTAASGVLSADAIALNYVGPLDGGVIIIDAGVPDAGRPDAGSVDAGSVDAGRPDAGSVDADAGTVDAGAADAGDGDAGLVDAGAVDAGAADSGSEEDAGGPLTDAGALADAGASVDAGQDEGVAGGCGCTSAPGSTTFLLLGALVAFRARRRSAAKLEAAASCRTSPPASRRSA